MTDQDASQTRFRDLVAAHWAAVDNGDAKAADHRTEELDQLVRNVAQSGETNFFLLRLLSEAEAPTVRVAAATYSPDRPKNPLEYQPRPTKRQPPAVQPHQPEALID